MNRWPTYVTKTWHGHLAHASRGRLALAGGFTLIEVLVASTMVAVLAGSLFASLFVAMRARNSALAAVETVRRCNLTIDLMRADLLSTVPPGSSANTALAGAFTGLGGQGMTGTGNADLIFYASAPDIQPEPGIGDIKRVEYCCMPADSGQFTLVRLVTTNLLSPTTVDPTQEIICKSVRAFTVRYFDGAAWQDSWDSTTTTPTNALPTAVEVTIELDDGSGQAARPISTVIPIPVGQGIPAASGGAM